MKSQDVTLETELSSFLAASSAVAIEFDSNERISARVGDFVPFLFAPESNLLDSCDFVFGVPETMAVGEVLALDGMHFASKGGENYIVDVVARRHGSDRFSLVIADQTDRYKMINQLSQQRNEADIYHHRLARQNDQLKLLKQAAEAASQTRTEFLAKVSHEIRTPLNALLGFAKMLNETGLDNKQQRHLDHIHTAGNALSGLLNDLLDLSKMESGKYQIESDVFDLSSVLEDATTLCLEKANQKGLTLLWDIDGDIPTKLLGDQLRISQVVLNLLTNAIKFTDEGKVSVTASCGEKSPVSTMVHILVSDTGRGIPHEQQSQIFERFAQSQLADSTELGGVGLGLAIVRQLVEAMGGNISVTSEPGAGAEFKVVLPLKRVPKSGESDGVDSLPKSDTLVAPAIAQDLEGVAILVAEDNKMNQQYVRELLEPLNPTLFIVDSGQAAIQILLSEPIDLLLTDIHMPEMNGEEAIKKIREEFLFPLNSIPIVAFTGRATEEDQAGLVKIGANHTLAKPFSPASLLEAIAKVRIEKQPAKQRVDRLLSQDVSLEMIQIFKEEVPAYLRDLLLALFNQQERQFVFQAHKMQSAMWVMELMAFYELLAQLENEPLGFDERLKVCTELCKGVERLLVLDSDDESNRT